MMMPVSVKSSTLRVASHGAVASAGSGDVGVGGTNRPSDALAVGDDDGVAAPRLAQLHPTVDEAGLLYDQLRVALAHVIEAGYAHGDLSPYNILVHHGRLVLIDLPQAVDLVENPQALAFLRRDCDNVCAWFLARGVQATGEALFNELAQTM